MYTINLDDKIIYYPGDSECTVIDPVVKLSIGQAGSCEFTVPPTNPLYNAIYNRKSIVTVYRGSKMIFRGEVRESTKDRRKCRKIYAVGELAYLLDSIQPQWHYGPTSNTGFMNGVLSEHNNQVEERKRISMGSNYIIPAAFKSKITDYDDTLTALRTQLDPGGYLRLRYSSAGKRYLDYVDLINYGALNRQGINFGENLLDYTENLTSSDIATEVIPLGVRLEGDDEELEKRLDITGVNNGKNYLSSESAINSFGHVRRVVVFDEIDDANTLKQAGKDWLKKAQYETMTLKITAADLSALDSTLDDMAIGDQIPCYAPPYGIDITLPIIEQTLHLTHPEKDTIILSASIKNKKRTISGQLYDSNTGVKNEVYKEELKIRSVIAREVANIMSQFTGSEGGHKLEEYDENGLWVRTSYMNGTSKATSTKIMEFSMDGIRFYKGSAGNYNDPTKWKSAWTLGGDFCADFITTGTLMGERVKAGVIQDVGEKTNWDLETGKWRSGTNEWKEYIQIYEGVIKGIYNNTDIGYIDLSANIKMFNGSTGHAPVIGSNNELNLEFRDQINFVDLRQDRKIVAYIDGNGFHGQVGD